jgi:D-sedoheptulose 7-phosphate isomerase
MMSDNQKYFALYRKTVQEHLALAEKFFQENDRPLMKLAEEITSSLNQGGKILLFGNGGSAADAQHIAAEFVNKLDKKRKAIPAIALTTDTSIITSVANDSSFHHIFSRQIEALGRKGDLAIGISTSGSSKNVSNGLKTASRKGLKTAALLGKDGGNIKNLVSHSLIVRSSSTQRIQEIHSIIGHLLCALVEEKFLL